VPIGSISGRVARVVVVHDTTAFEFGGQSKCEGLGHLIKPSAHQLSAGDR
jgi:hypothetical protein